MQSGGRAVAVFAPAGFAPLITTCPAMCCHRAQPAKNCRNMKNCAFIMLDAGFSQLMPPGSNACHLLV